MIEINKIAFQGDVCIKRVKSIPAKFKRTERSGPVIVAHSETGHHHQVDDMGVVSFESDDPLKAYLLLESTDHCDVVHHRAWDTHETIRLGGGVGSVFEITRQREYSPQGWRRVQD